MRFKRRERPTHPGTRTGWRPWRVRSDAEMARIEHYEAFDKINEELLEKEESAQEKLLSAERLVTDKAMRLVGRIGDEVRPLAVKVMGAEEAYNRDLKEGEYLLEEHANYEEKRQGFKVIGKLKFAKAAESLDYMIGHISHIRKKEILQDVANHASLELTSLRALKVEDLELFVELSKVEDELKTILARKEKKEAEIFKVLKGHLAGPSGSPSEAEEILNNTGHTSHKALKDAIMAIATKIEEKFADERKWKDYIRKLKIAVKALFAELNEAIGFAKMELRAIKSQSHIDRVAKQLSYKTREIVIIEDKLLESIDAAFADLKHFEDTQLRLMDHQAALIERLYDETKLEVVKRVPKHPETKTT